MATATQFCLLGPLTVHCGGDVIPVPQGKPRAALATLLLNANHVVPVDELAESLWGSEPPPSARVTVQNHVRRLRKALAATGDSRIVTVPPGYLITVAASDLDVSRFEVLLRSARAAALDGSWDRAAGQARAALSLWRGEPLADAGSEFLITTEVPRLAEMRLQAIETRIDADLHLGRHAAVITELQRLAEAHPLREHLHGLLMLALCRDGRRAEALAAYQRARKVLIEELGAEPGSELRELQYQILTADPALAVPQPAGPMLRARQPMPQQLPPAVAGFTGRSGELAALTRMLDDAGGAGPGTVVISAIGGTAGVGKTALAVYWAHQIAYRFPDGQLHVNLRGFDPSGTPATLAQAIRGFLDALGVPPERIPPQPDAQVGLYRSLLAGKRMVIVLDNARDEQQVRPLLPASAGSLVLVTSRNQLAGLAADGARLLGLDILPPGEAMQLLSARLGEARSADEPAAVAEIAALCAWLPLALAVAAARADGRPGFPLAALAAELRDAIGRLDALDAGDPATSVRAVFSWSYRQLSSQAARMFRLLGLHPGPDISIPAAASLTSASVPQAWHMLRELTRAHLITEHAPGRYAFHDLLRVYAAAQARDTDSEPERGEAIGRVLDHYLHTAAHGCTLISPGREPVTLTSPRPGTALEQPADHRQALAWFEAEHQVLLAAATLAAESVSGGHSWQLPWAVATYLLRRGHFQEIVVTNRAALAAATHLGDIGGQAVSGRLLAGAFLELGDYEQALGYFMASLELYRQIGNRHGEAKLHQNLGMLAGRQGRYADALAHAEQALHLYQAVGDKAGEAGALNSVGWHHGHLGDFEQARAFCLQALALSEKLGYRMVEGYSWDSLGYVEHHLGNFGEAAACYQRALANYRELGDRFYEAETLTHLGDTHHAAGDLPQAREAWQQALDILEDIEHPDARQVRAKLDSADEAGRVSM